MKEAVQLQYFLVKWEAVMMVRSSAGAMDGDA